ncbi:hypothetical protein ACHAP5_011484 [Fusarium lateritium]
MNPLSIQSWLNNIPEIHTPPQSPQQPLKRKRDEADLSGPLISPMSSPPKRDAPDLDQTPQSLKDLQQQGFLRRDFAFRSSQSPTKRRRASPSKRHTTTASLKLLDPPIHVVNPEDLTSALPDDLAKLYEELYLVINKMAILPANLNRIMDTETLKRAKILPYMWQTTDDRTKDESLRYQHERLKDILHEAAEASTMTKGESAWNAQVHYPILDLALKPIPTVRPETITSAQIIKDFRPISLDQTWSSASSSAASSVTSEQDSSVHKMVDFALVLLPDAPLEAKIKAFLAKEDYSTVNHTMYDALSRRPAPVFIETKTSAGVVDRSHAQLGIWTAAWFSRLRAAKSSRLVTGVPVIQVHGHVWTVMFAMDEGDKIVS